jgi:hypothetical protein
MYIGILLYVLIVFSLRRESLKLILVDETLPEGILSQQQVNILVVVPIVVLRVIVVVPCVGHLKYKR